MMFLRNKKAITIIVILVCLVLVGSTEYVSRRVCVRFMNLLRSESGARYLDPIMAKIWPISDKFWMHRANGLMKLETVGQKYSGIEIDINYYPAENAFDVSHDGQTSIEYPLEDTLAYLGQNRQKVWIDYKNLNLDNAEQSFRKRRLQSMKLQSMKETLLQNHLMMSMIIHSRDGTRR